MRVLTLKPHEAANHYDRYVERSAQPIRMFVWTKNVREGDDEDETSDITEVLREELDDLVLEEDQELRVDAGMWVQKIHQRHMEKPLVGLFSEEMREEPWGSLVSPPTQLTLILGLFNEETARAVLKQLTDAVDEAWG